MCAPSLLQPVSCPPFFCIEQAGPKILSRAAESFLHFKKKEKR